MNSAANSKSCAQSGNTRTHLDCRMAIEEMFDRLLLGNAPNRSSEFPRQKGLINVSPVGTLWYLFWKIQGFTSVFC